MVQKRFPLSFPRQESASEAMAAPHLALVPSPGMGHLIPIAEFAKRLVPHGITATIINIVDNASPSQIALLERLPEAVNHVNLPDINLDDLPPDVKVETVVAVVAVRSLPSLRLALADLKKTRNLVALVGDLFGGFFLEVAKELSIRPYILFPSTATLLSLFLWLQQLDAQTTGEYRDLPDPIRLPGCIPLHGGDLVDPAQDRKNDAYAWLLKLASRLSLAEGIFLNSFESMEGETIKALKADKGVPPVYPVGPLVQTGGDETERDSSGCLTWLDRQQRGSVLFVSFGSGGTLSLAQLTELALGLEASGVRFLWVVRSPCETRADGAYLNVGRPDEPLTFLPEGFLDRTRQVGMVVTSWAPQVQVLHHVATGGFLTHCGWNSVLESAVHGVPMIAWPLYAEQKMNAAMMVEGAKVAVRARVGEKGVVEREEVVKVVKNLMEGEEGKRARGRLSRVKEEAAKVLVEGGASYEALVAAAEDFKRFC